MSNPFGRFLVWLGELIYPPKKQPFSQESMRRPPAPDQGYEDAAEPIFDDEYKIFLIEANGPKEYIIRNYDGEVISFYDNWNLTHFEQILIFQDEIKTKIILPNGQDILVLHKKGLVWTEKNFYAPRATPSDHNGIPKQIYTGTQEDDVYHAPWSISATLKGLGGKDKLIGSILGDLIEGGDGDDDLDGGDDDVGGEYGDDTIDGGPGNDLIKAGKGNNRLTGGTGKDTFVIVLEEGKQDIITDYNPKEDSILLKSDSSPGVFKSLEILHQGDDTLVVFPTGGSEGKKLLLKNIKKESITPYIFKWNEQPLYTGIEGDDRADGDDTIDSGPENGLIKSGRGNNILTGDRGADIFVILSSAANTFCGENKISVSQETYIEKLEESSRESTPGPDSDYFIS